MHYRQIIDFWFDEISPSHWWQKDEAFDALIAERFLVVHQRAVECELYAWREHPLGRLAEVIVLDQFSRNIYRDTPQSFAYDTLALGLAQEAVAISTDGAFTHAQKSFLYMPYMHSESVAIHEIAVELFNQPGLEDNLNFEIKHKVIIDRFGRYPHRNKILGRESTPEELTFLNQPGSSF